MLIYDTLHIRILLISFSFMIAPVLCGSTITNEKNLEEFIYQPVIPLDLNEPDTIILNLKEQIVLLKEKKDTSRTIENLLKITRRYIDRLDYINAYDAVLETLRLSESISDSVNISEAYEILSEINISYGQKSYSVDYINKAIAINKKLIKTNSDHYKALASNYYYASLINRMLYNYNVALKYIDTCLKISNESKLDSIHKCYHYSDKAYSLIKLGNYQEGEEILFRVKEYLESLHKTPDNKVHIDYLIFPYTYLGLSYYKKGDFKQSKYFFHKSLHYMHKNNAHWGMKAYVLYQISRIYSKEGNMAKAYETMHSSKILFDKVYGINSRQNSYLLEAKSRYQEEIKRKNGELYQNSLLLANREKSLLKIRFALIIFFITGLLAVFIVRNRNQRLRFKHEKDASLRESIFKEQAAKHLLEVKNKELTTYTLQFIEKDKTNKALLKMLKRKKDLKDIAPYISSIQSKHSLWDEFNHRFNSVNTGFYDRLSTKFPDLSATDLKHCALIKLNFTGKEMSHLLGISLSSVHTARHRIRKKMNLDREASLANFISKI